jgi:putative Holliday junction resolvase
MSLLQLIPDKGKILTFDLGAKRIGIAASDENQIIASAVESYSRVGFDKDVRHLAQYCKTLDAVGVVVGWPVDMNGRITRSGKMVDKFVVALSPLLDIPLVKHDERFSTAIAQQVLVKADLSRARRKQVIDKMAAVVILQSFMDSRT